ncbi:hypothetical protein AALM74_25330 [Parabacteroides segnis]|uniref:hypothetical protein n=1 Tax=Parabacteroides segnis TaxID=2763058 RepID=UPI0035158F57
MIVDKTRKVIFLHNPKSGGTFLRNIYKEKYGESEATVWWNPYTRKNGTDLGHISYNDLPRFVPGWEEYRLLVMIRNPYNRFYSSVKELKGQHYYPARKYKLFSVPRFKQAEFQEWNVIRKWYELIRWACPGFRSGGLKRMLVLPEKEWARKLCSLSRSRQNFFLRNKRYPWLNPQSDFTGEGVEILHYESERDWCILLDAFGLSDYSDRVSIAKEYEISAQDRIMIERLYPEDASLFLPYKV